jgi:hypothetical protein
MSEIDAKLMGASMEQHVQLSFEFQSVTDRDGIFLGNVQPVPGASHHRFEVACDRSRSNNVVMLNNRSSAGLRHDGDLISRIVKSVRFFD